jgi:hypothetical protein
MDLSDRRSAAVQVGMVALSPPQAMPLTRQPHFDAAYLFRGHLDGAQLFHQYPNLISMFDMAQLAIIDLDLRML